MDKGTCIVVLGDGAPCGRPVAYKTRTRCEACRQWSRYHGGADPTGRPRRARRRNGELQAELQRAARSTSTRCVILTGYSQRPAAEVLGVHMSAARAVWTLANGDPGEEHVLHTCHRGEEGCINIRHLYLGDTAQNVRDKVEAGRQTRGEDHPANKLTTQQVRNIRETFAAGGISKSELARQYAIAHSTVRAILDRRRWKHV